MDMSTRKSTKSVSNDDIDQEPSNGFKTNTKICNSCGAEKPISHFLHKHLYVNMCRQCRVLGNVKVTSPSLDKRKFISALESTIDLKIAELIASKQNTEKHLSYFDAQILVASVRNVFKYSLGFTPPQVDAACQLSEAILAPTKKKKKNLIKGAIGLGGGSAGIGLVVSGVGAALGWGTGIVASVSAVFVGTSFAGPVGWILAGVSLAAIAGYLAMSSDDETDTERFIKVLKNSSSKAVEAIWKDHGEELSLSMVTSKPSA